MGSRSTCNTQHTIQDSRESVNFRDYRRNPLEFLGRVDEILNRSKENRWNMIKGILDECFKNINDNWWTVIRNEVCDYGNFKMMFKLKYWSESVQNIIRDDICHGRYDRNIGQTPTAYFLGKVCVAKYLDPKIPEECLVTKIAYHFEEKIISARLSGQIKTIGGMETLLENYEQESYYRRSRWRSGNTEERKNEPPRDNRPRVNYVCANNNYYNNRYRGRGQNYNNRNYRNDSYQREEGPCLLYTSRCV